MQRILTGPESAKAKGLDGVMLVLTESRMRWKSARQMTEHQCWAGDELISVSLLSLSGGKSDWQGLILLGLETT